MDVARAVWGVPKREVDVGCRKVQPQPILLYIIPLHPDKWVIQYTQFSNSGSIYFWISSILSLTFGLNREAIEITIFFSLLT